MTTIAASTASAAEISLRRTCSPSATASQEAYNRIRSSVTVAIAVLRPALHQRLPRTYLKFNHWGNDRGRGACELSSGSIWIAKGLRLLRSAETRGGSCGPRAAILAADVVGYSRLMERHKVSERT